MLQEPWLGTQDEQAGGWPGKTCPFKAAQPGQAQSSSSSGEFSTTSSARDENIPVLQTKSLPSTPSSTWQEAAGEGLKL